MGYTKSLVGFRLGSNQIMTAPSTGDHPPPGAQLTPRAERC